MTTTPDAAMIERATQWIEGPRLALLIPPIARANPSRIKADIKSLAELLAAERALALAQQWRPIETVPHDGSWFLAYSSSGNWRRISWGTNRFGENCWCASDYWWLESDNTFSHWQPLPAPPKDTPETKTQEMKS